MRKKLLKEILPFNLQFFAEHDPTNEPDPTNESEDTNGGTDQNESGNEKTFTQKEVNAIMAKEKRQGKNSVLKNLGFDSEEDAKKAFNLLKALTDSQKTAEQKVIDEKDEAAKGKDKAEERAIKAENKLACLMAGVSKDCIDDVLAIASAKVDEDNDLSDVLEDMKKNKKYALFFGESEEPDDEPSNGNKGTGAKPKNNKGGKDESGNLGERLAKNSSKPAKKSSYF